MFVRNAWYVAAWGRDLKDASPLPVTLLGENVVLYRQSDGRPAALEDACAHRKLPLSMGRIRGNEIECGYHGLRFDAQGRCVHIPCSDRIPRNAHVRSYPVHERYGLLWIWMGEPESARTETIMSIEHWGNPAWAITDGDTMTVDCNYLFMTDNLLDPSHVAWVHPTSFGDAACETTAVEVTGNADGITASRWMYSTDVAPLYRRFVPFAGRCDRLQHYEVRFPCQALIKAVFVPEGGAVAAPQRIDDAFVMYSYNLLTPIDETHTRYFWFQIHNAPASDPEASDALSQAVKAAFEEDRVILGAVQRGFTQARTPPIDIPIDSAPLRFRRRIRSIIEAEQVDGQVRAADHSP